MVEVGLVVLTVLDVLCPDLVVPTLELLFEGRVADLEFTVLVLLSPDVPTLERTSLGFFNVLDATSVVFLSERNAVVEVVPPLVLYLGSPSFPYFLLADLLDIELEYP